MSDEKKSIGLNTEDWYCLNIGRFIFQFSQLEFTLRFILSQLLKLREDVATPLLSSVDFASLCRALKTIYSVVYPKDGARIAQVDAYLKEVMALNNDHRVPIAHGLWHHDVTSTYMSAQHVSRNSHQTRRLYEDPEELPRLVAKLSDYHTQAWFIFGGSPKTIGMDRKIDD